MNQELDRPGERSPTGSGTIVGKARIAFTRLAALPGIVALYRGKWPKLRLLVAERVNMFRGSRPASHRAVDEAAVTRIVRSWHSELLLPVALVRDAEPYSQDRLTNDDRLATDIDYAVVVLPGASMWTNELTHRTVFSANGRAIEELSSFRGAPPRHHRPALRVQRQLPGRTLNLYGMLAMAGGNYGHWLIDGVSRIFLVERAGLLETIDQVVVPVAFHDFHIDSLTLLGFEPSRIVQIEPLQVLGFEELVCTSPPRGYGSGVQPGWAVDGFRRAAQVDETSGKGRRLYISRRDAATRRFLNEDALIERLTSRGFETIELADHDMAGKITLFAEAEAVIGLSGAGLINAMFLPASATLLELFPPALLNYGIASICAHRHVRYEWLVCEDASMVSKLNRYAGDLTLDPDELDRALDALGLR